MFNKLLHGLTATVMRVKQLWTKDNVPSSVSTRHDFKDGEGLVPASPVDICGISNTAMSVMPIDIHVDGCGISNTAISVLEIPKSIDTCGIENQVINVIEFPRFSEKCGIRTDIILLEPV